MRIRKSGNGFRKLVNISGLAKPKRSRGTESVTADDYEARERLSIYNVWCRLDSIKPGVHTNDFVTIHGRPARIHTAPAESTVDSTYCLPQALCEYARGDRESWRNR